GKCESMKSVSLERLELGGLRAPKADFSYSNISCANLARANLANTNFEGATIHGSDLRGANLRGADLRVKDFRATKLSWAFFDAKTKIDPDQIKCACVDFYADGGAQIQQDLPEKIANILKTLQRCPPDNSNVCEPTFLDKWACSK